MLTFESGIGSRRPGAGFVARVLLVAALGAALPGAAWAGSDGRKGTDGAYELKLPVGPRGSVLGAAVTADATGVEALFFNPAGLAFAERPEVLFTHTQYIADMKINYAAMATKLGGVGVLALGAKVLSIGDIIVTTEDAPEGTGEILNPTFTTLGASFARQFTDRVTFGFTTNLVSERIANASATGLAVDFGVQYLTGWNGLKLGVAMKNFGPAMEYGGPDFETSFQPPGSDPTAANRVFRSSPASFEMPSYFTLGATYDAWRTPEYRLTVMSAYQSNNFSADNMCGAFEWAYKDWAALRGSFFGSIRETPDPVSGETTLRIVTGDDVYSGYALGGGINVRTGETRMGVDVAWRPVREFFDDTVEVGLKVAF